MTSRYVKPTFAILAALALSLAFAARTIAAPAAGLNWEVHGTGSGGVNLLGGGSSGPAMSQYIGNGTYSVNLLSPVFFSNTGAGGACDVVTGSGSVTAANGDTISFATVGMLCNESDAFSPFHYNGTYRITAGHGPVAGDAVGGSAEGAVSAAYFLHTRLAITGV